MRGVKDECGVASARGVGIRANVDGSRAANEVHHAPARHGDRPHVGRFD